MFITLSNQAIWDEVLKNIHQRFVDYMNLAEYIFIIKQKFPVYLIGGMAH